MFSKNFISVAAIVFLFSLFLIPSHSVHAGTLSPFSYSASSYVKSATSTYTFTYTTATPVSATPDIILQILFPNGFNLTGINPSTDITVTVNGSPTSIDALSFISGQQIATRITTPVAGGSNVVVAIAKVLNNASAGTYTFSVLRTADLGGNPYDTPSSIDSLVITDTAPPTAPTSAAIGLASTSTLALSWASGGAGGNETQFVIERSQSNCTGSFTQIATTSTSTLSYSVTGLSPETQYCFRVASASDSATSTYSTTTADFTLPNTPLQPTISDIMTTSLRVNLPSDDNPYGISLSSLYSIQETGSLLWNDYPNGTLVGSEGFTSRNAWNLSSLTGLTPNSPYSFRSRIALRNSGGGYSSYSATSTVAYTLASTPTSVSATPSTNSIVLSWTGDGTSYVISNDTTSATSSSSATSTTISNLSCNTAYDFRVKALNGSSVETSYSAVTTVTTSACPAASTGGTRTGGSTIGWRPPTVPVVIQQATSTQQIVKNSFNFTRNLQIGSVGNDVNELQKFLISQNLGKTTDALFKNGLTNYFGKLTRAALVEYQKAKGITPAIGYFGPKTRESVGK